ncbi:Alpha/beta-hydrolase [Mycena venus]|uniref:Alpha/beta-hydrolase n=1 Tax=Mycena venus TaxID=2733690 RepID=A0A8H7D2J4_9AGAR|nr:Alpha/beta-hydrolase [Mycena venus]
MHDVTSHILHSNEHTLAGLTLTFKRYRPLPASGTKCPNATRVALVFVHCIGTHKETWAPVIEYLYQFQSSASCSVIIAEAWSMDLPNHGEAAAINQKILLERPQGIFKRRQDIWESREIACAWFAKRLPWKRWNTHILDAFIQYGLRDLPTAAYPDRANGVTLSCTRGQEAAGYIYHQDSVDANKRLKDLCLKIPVHCIFGDEMDLITDETRRGIYQGRRMESITGIDGAGHLVTQETPFKLAQAVWTALNHDYANQGKYKL